jgi:hypothetical protein
VDIIKTVFGKSKNHGFKTSGSMMGKRYAIYLFLVSAETKSANEVCNEPYPFGTHIDVSCFVVSVLPQEQDNEPPKSPMRVQVSSIDDEDPRVVTVGTELAINEVRHESDPFGTHDNTCCFVASVHHVHQEQVQQDDIKDLEPQDDSASMTKRPRRSRVSNGGPLRRSARLAQKYPRRSPRLAAKRLAAKP